MLQSDPAAAAPVKLSLLCALLETAEVLLKPKDAVSQSAGHLNDDWQVWRHVQAYKAVVAEIGCMVARDGSRLAAGST